MAVQLADEEGPKSPRPESTTARPQQPRQFRRATIRPDANEPGHFEQIKGTKLRMWISADAEHSFENHMSMTQEFGKVENIKVYDAMHYTEPHTFFHPFVPRQFILNDTFYIERRERQASWDELFYDLVYIAVIIEIGQILSMAQLTLQSVHQFILVMIPIWNSWMLLDRVTNMFGAQNVTYKAFSGLYHILVATMGVNAGNTFDPNPQANTAPIFLSAYFLTQILCLIMCFTLYLTVPTMASAYIAAFVGTIFCGVPSLFGLWYPQYQIALWWTSWVLQVFSFKAIILIKNYAVKKPYGILLNIDHHLERVSLLTIIILGEVVAAVMWTSKSRNFSDANIMTVCTIAIAICIQYIYYYGDGQDFIHSMRRHQIAGLVWQTVHLPLHLATIIAGAAVALFIADGEQMALLQLEVERNGSLTSSQLNTLLSEQTINRSLDIFIICIGIILVHLFFLSLLHKQPTKGNERLFPSWIIISARLAAAGGLFALMSGAHHWSPVQVLQITCGTWLVLVVVNIVGMKRKNASMKDTLCHFDLAQR